MSNIEKERTLVMARWLVNREIKEIYDLLFILVNKNIRIDFYSVRKKKKKKILDLSLAFFNEGTRQLGIDFRNEWM